MRHIARKIAVAVAAFGIASSCIAADQVRWAPNIDQARLMAAQQNKLLLIHFWSPMCGPCKTVDAKVFPNSAVGAAVNQNFVALKVNAASQEGRQLTAHFNVDQVPTDVISTVDGKALHRMVSDTKPAAYAQKISTLGQQFAMMAKYKSQNGSQQQPQMTSTAKPYNNSQQQPASMATEPPVGSPGVSDSQLGVTRSALSPSTAVARRPGVNTKMLAGRDLGNQQPGYTAPQLGVGNRFSAPSNAPAAQPQPRPQDTTPAYSAAGSQSRHSPSISNPYASQPAMPTQTQNSVQSQQPSANQYVAPSQNITPPPVATTSQYTSQQGVNALATPTNPTPGAGAAPGFVNPAPQGVPLATTQSVQPQTLNPMASAKPRGVAELRTDGTPIRPTGDSAVGLEGRCPVWLITNGTWKKGDKRWGAVHRGKTYLFSSQEAQQKFLTAPDDYSPVLAGMDIVRLATDGAVAQGTRRFGVLFDDDGAGPRRSRMFLFDSVETRNRFESDPDVFLQPVMQAINSGQLDRLIR